MVMVKVLLTILAWLARFFAWSFAVATLLGVFWMLLMRLQRGDRHPTMMSNGLTDAWGLTYAGRGGAILALLELVLLVGALWASGVRSLAYRSIGHLILILWAGLWTANAFYVFGDGSFGLIYLLPFFFLCACVRAALDLSRPSPPVAA